MRIALIGANRTAVTFIRTFFCKPISCLVQIVVIPVEVFNISNSDRIGGFENEFYQLQNLGSSFVEIELLDRIFSPRELLGFDEIVFCSIAWSDHHQLPSQISQCKQVLDLESLIDIEKLSNLVKKGSRVAIQAGSEKSIQLGISLASKGYEVFLYHRPGEQVLFCSDIRFLDLLHTLLKDQGIEFGYGLDNISNSELAIWNLDRGSSSALLDYLGIDYDQGIKVCPSLQTLDDDHIWALGISAQIDGVVLGNGDSLHYQVSQVIDGILERTSSNKNPIHLRVSSNSLDILGFGSFEDDLDTFYYLDTRQGIYRAIQVEDGYLRAGIFLGIDKQVLYLVQLWQKNSYFFNENPMLAISPPSPPALATSPLNMPGSMLVCQCNLVKKSDIVSAAQQVDSFGQLQQITKASLGCGGCLSLTNSIYQWVVNTQESELNSCVNQ